MGSVEFVEDNVTGSVKFVPYEAEHMQEQEKNERDDDGLPCLVSKNRKLKTRPRAKRIPMSQRT